MSDVARAHLLLTFARQDLAANIWAQCHLTLWARRLTQWHEKVLGAWRTTMLGMRFQFQHSLARTSLVMREQVVTSVLDFNA